MTVSTTDEVVLPSARPTRRWRFGRFSLLSFLLAVSLICVSASNFRLGRDNQLLKKKNDELMTEMGYLVVHDPTKIYMRPVEKQEDSAENKRNLILTNHLIY